MIPEKKERSFGRGWIRVAVGLAISLGAIALSTTVQSQQRSADRNSPVPLRSNVLSDSLQEADGAAYYYSVMAGPGEIVFSLRVNSTGAQSYLELTVFDGNDRLLLKLEATSSSKNGGQAKLRLDRQQPLLLQLKGRKFNAFGSYQLGLTGNLSFGGGAAAPIEQPGKPLSQSPVVKDSNPPRIVITSPDPTLGQGAKAGKIVVTGQATDESGIREVTVLGQAVRFDGDGRFSAEVSLQPGENQIVVTATDAFNNRAEQKVTITRDLALVPVSGVRPAPPAGIEGKYYALLIGVEKYQHSDVKSLDYPVGDARKVRETLTRHYTFEPGNITLLENPDRDGILSELDQLEEVLGPEDHLLIFYAGHGHWDKERQQGYWLPSDARRTARSNWISNSDLRDAIQGIKARHTLVIADACFSGGLLVTREAFAKPPVVDEMLKLKSRTAMTSGALTTVPDRSVFVRYLLGSLEGNTAPFLLASDLFGQIRTPVINNSPKQSDGNRPTPRYGIIAETDDGGGDFVFVRRR